MPTYRYRCSACGHEFDQYQRFTDDALTVCPSCNGAIRRVIQPVGVVFKGSGWYINDSRKSESAPSTVDKPAAKADGDKPAASETSATPDPKNNTKETTPAGKPAKDTKSAAAV
jgi:putative FmdB family regulatory protein